MSLKLIFKSIEQYDQQIEAQQSPTIQKQIDKSNVEEQRLVYRQKYKELRKRVLSYPGFNDSPNWEVDIGVPYWLSKNHLTIMR